MDLIVELRHSDGMISAEASILDFKKNVLGELESIAKHHKLCVKTDETPAPEGALGVEEICRYIVENFDSIAQTSKNLAIIVQAVNTLAQLFIKRKREEAENKSQVEIKIGKDAIQLPANSKEIDEFVAKIRESEKK
jgi:hypothetical protein